MISAEKLLVTKIKQVVLASFVLLVVLYPSKGRTQDETQLLTPEAAIELITKPSKGMFGNMSPFELQCHYRLAELHYFDRYKYEDQHAASWKACMHNEKTNMYARLTAAYFLLKNDKEAREFITKQLSSTNLMHRFNAAEVVNLYVGRDSSKKWGINTLIKLLADGSIDGSGVSGSPRGDFPNGDRNDIMHTPIDSVCFNLGFMKTKQAVPSLISVLERRPRTPGAAFALGEIGDNRAIPILLKTLKNRSNLQGFEVEALGKLKCKDAVPLLISRLGRPSSGMAGGEIETEKVLDALLQIGDERALKPIKEYLDGEHPKHSKAVAERVLVQLESQDAVKSLLALFEKETYEPELSDIITALTKFQDERVVSKLASVASSSDSAFLRREAIFGLRDIGDRESLLVLASLFDLTFSNDLTAEWGWKGIPEFREYFPKTINMCLKQATKQDFGVDRKKWEYWIAKNVESSKRRDK